MYEFLLYCDHSKDPTNSYNSPKNSIKVLLLQFRTRYHSESIHKLHVGRLIEDVINKYHYVFIVFPGLNNIKIINFFIFGDIDDVRCRPQKS